MVIKHANHLIEPKLPLIRITTRTTRQTDEIAAMEFMLVKMKNTKSNDEFFASMKR